MVRPPDADVFQSRLAGELLSLYKAARLFSFCKPWHFTTMMPTVTTVHTCHRGLAWQRFGWEFSADGEDVRKTKTCRWKSINRFPVVAAASIFSPGMKRHCLSMFPLTRPWWIDMDENLIRTHIFSLSLCHSLSLWCLASSSSSLRRLFITPSPIPLPVFPFRHASFINGSTIILEGTLPRVYWADKLLTIGLGMCVCVCYWNLSAGVEARERQMLVQDFGSMFQMKKNTYVAPGPHSAYGPPKRWEALSTSR